MDEKHSLVAKEEGKTTFQYAVREKLLKYGL